MGGYSAFVASLTDPRLASAAPAPAAGLTLYPNPALHRATVQVPVGTTAVLVRDALGRPVRHQAVATQAPAFALDLTGLPAGLYLVQTSGGPVVTGRLRVE